MSEIPAMVRPSWPSTLFFTGIVLGLCALLVLATARSGRALSEPSSQTFRVTLAVAVATVLWLLVTAAVSVSSVLQTPSLPPPLALFMASSLAVAIGLACSPFGTRLARGIPIAALIGVQAFRLPLELVLHAWKEQGALPIQMTFEGRNFDILTGALAIGVALWLHKRGPSRAAVWAFNLVGLALLINVGAIAVLSSPLPFRRFMNDPPVLLAFHFPYGWIVPFCVGGALFVHIVTFRWLALSRA